MAHTYYSRLSLVRPDDVNELDPRLGIVIAETATTGRFILSDITWDSSCAPNAKTLTTLHTTGDLKLYEPMGMAMFDYIKAAAFKLGMMNHLDARFLLEIEILGENLPKEGSPYKYIWPIMFIASDIKSSVSEKGTEYNIKFIHSGHHGQTDLVQPIKETSKIEAGTVGDYLQKLQNDLETKEYKYAAARQKAGSGAVKGGDNPAFTDDFHDEYHFIVQDEIKKFKFTSLGKNADSAVQGTWLGAGALWGSYNITARPGITLTQHINRILQSTEESANMLLGRNTPKSKAATGSSAADASAIESELGNVYQFFRIESFSVYKAFDYIRQRYAVRHIFFVFLADQPNMYQYPDEIALINKEKNKDKAIKKLQYYIQEGLLQKLYYHNYTGLNTEILKVDINFNQTYSLPSFPVLWADRGEAGPGRMNLQNYNRRVSPYVHKDELGILRQEISSLRNRAVDSTKKLNELNKTGAGKMGLAPWRQALNKAEADIKRINEELAIRERELSTKQASAGSVNTIKNRQELLKSLQYAEDYTAKDFGDIYNEYMQAEFPTLNPRMEPDNIAEDIDKVKSENEKLMQKIYSVLTSPRHLVELELEIFADPFWLGPPNVLAQGAKGLDKIQFPKKNSDAIKQLINENMTRLDPRWGTKEPVWGDYGVAPIYQGAPLFYFLTKVPGGQADDDLLLEFNSKDQIHGIYMVHEITNEFKEGKWTQKLKAIRDISIPSNFIPTGAGEEMSFEDFVGYTQEQPNVAEELKEKAREDERKRTGEAERENLQGTGAGAAGVQLSNTLSSKPGISEAYNRAQTYLADNPPPPVANPVATAQELVNGGMSKKEAYAQAKAQYETELGGYFNHLETANKHGYAQAGVSGVQPYSADTMKSLAIQRSGAGGLNDWRAGNTTMPGPADLNNPMAIGGDPTIGRYGKFDSFEQGLKAGNDYYNYGSGIKSNAIKADDRLLLPTTWKGSQLDFIKMKSVGGKG